MLKIEKWVDSHQIHIYYLIFMEARCRVFPTNNPKYDDKIFKLYLSMVVFTYCSFGYYSTSWTLRFIASRFINSCKNTLLRKWWQMPPVIPTSV